MNPGLPVQPCARLFRGTDGVGPAGVALVERDEDHPVVHHPAEEGEDGADLEGPDRDVPLGKPGAGLAQGREVPGRHALYDDPVADFGRVGIFDVRGPGARRAQVDNRTARPVRQDAQATWGVQTNAILVVHERHAHDGHAVLVERELRAVEGLGPVPRRHFARAGSGDRGEQGNEEEYENGG